MAAAYERLIRPAPYRWPDWVVRCRTQAGGGLAALAALSWPADGRLDQAAITTVCMMRYIGLADPELLPPGRYPSLDALSVRCEVLPPFRTTWPADYGVPAGGQPVPENGSLPGGVRSNI
jgi:hypothetical protein